MRTKNRIKNFKLLNNRIIVVIVVLFIIYRLILSKNYMDYKLECPKLKRNKISKIYNKFIKIQVS